MPRVARSKAYQGWRLFVPESFDNAEDSEPVQMEVRGMPQDLNAEVMFSMGASETLPASAVRSILYKCARSVKNYTDDEGKAIKNGADLLRGDPEFVMEVVGKVLEISHMTKEEEGN